MSNEIFAALRRRMTLMYSLIFGAAVCLIVSLTCGLVWLGVMSLEKEALAETAAWAAAEYDKNAAADQQSQAVLQHHGRGMGMHRGNDARAAAPHHGSRSISRSRLLPASNDNLLQIMVMPQGTALSDEARRTEAEPLLALQSKWPQKLLTAEELTVTLPDGSTGHYLTAAAPSKASPACTLYVFKDMSGYYALASSLISVLCGLLLLLFGGAAACSWWLAGKNIAPIAAMYARQQQFAADASHELRTPLSVLRLAVRALSEDEESKLSPFGRKNLSIMSEESTRLEKLTDELLFLTRSDNAADKEDFTVFDFSELARSVTEELLLPAAEKDILIESDVMPNLTIQGKESNLRRLLVILLDNAIKYSPEGSNIRLSAKTEGRNLIFCVADNGPGISDEEKPKVTGRFYRSDKARSRKQGGTGLGLSLAVAILNEHSGSLQILDNRPCGTVMQVKLPRLLHLEL